MSRLVLLTTQQNTVVHGHIRAVPYCNDIQVSYPRGDMLLLLTSILPRDC